VHHGALSDQVVFLASTLPGGHEARSPLYHVEAMSDEHVAGGAVPEQSGVSGASAKAEAKASPKKRSARPKIDLDEEIRRANDLAAMSRKMLQAAKASSKNNKRAKQRLIKKAGKLSPEDLERIAVLKRCGLFVEDGEDVQDNTEGDKGNSGNPPSSSAGVSLEEKKRPKLSQTLKSLAESNPILEEFGMEAFSKSQSASAPSSSSSSKALSGQRKGVLVLSKSARLPRGPSLARDESVAPPPQEDA